MPPMGIRTNSPLQLDQDAYTSKFFKLFVGAIPEHASEHELRSLFEPFGEILDLVILQDRFTRQPKGCGFVVFGDKHEADAAIDALADRVRMPGAQRELIVRYAGPRPDDSEFKLYVSMLSHATTEEEIRALFAPYGSLNEVVLLRQKDETAASKGSAFVKYNLRESAEAAIRALDRRYRDKVRFAHTRDEKEAHYRNQQPPLPHQLSNPSPTGFSHQAPHPPHLSSQQPQPPPQQQQQPPQPISHSTSASLFQSILQPNGPPQGAGSSHSASYPQQPSPPLHPSHASSNPNSAAPSGTPGTFMNNIARVARSDARGPDGCNLFIYNIPDYYNEEQLAHLFGLYGTLISTKIQRDRGTGHSRGYGFASYTDPRAAQQAISNLDGFVLDGKKINVRLKHNNGSIMGGNPMGLPPPSSFVNTPPPVAHAPAAQTFTAPLYNPNSAFGPPSSNHHHPNNHGSHHHSNNSVSSLSSTFAGLGLGSSASGSGSSSAPQLSANSSASSLSSFLHSSSGASASGSGAGSSTSSSVASASPQPLQSNSSTFEAVMQQALFLTQLQQQQQQQPQQSKHLTPYEQTEQQIKLLQAAAQQLQQATQAQQAAMAALLPHAPSSLHPSLSSTPQPPSPSHSL